MGGHVGGQVLSPLEGGWTLPGWCSFRMERCRPLFGGQGVRHVVGVGSWVVGEVQLEEAWAQTGGEGQEIWRVGRRGRC